ncbi:ESX secretion-associated protein EspG [Blastococcus xanthinilyticus]|uniref:ESAT-6 protein secretion system EspG family protein n=1 Tax=Blastococcus xanthinilyticus TaxID=1564164 RepID=A0A5S5CXN6_9ACTN|nr:ESX secretion-associated protein EspG [Blastococcus xanthinilyticus]TYP88550.1 ESAT-6 protein secretion system EspG family protein [Blastococcus xanthinilyticus]
MSGGPSRRLVLGPAEWSVLTGDRLPAAPPAFRAGPVDGRAWDAAAATLARRGVLTADGAHPVPAVSADLALLRDPLLTVRLTVAGPGGERSGWFALGRGMVVVLLTLPGGSVELSVAPAVRLGAELARAVPAAAAVTGAPSGAEPERPPSGRLPLALLEEPSAEASDGPDETALAGELLRRAAGSLSALVLGRTGGAVAAGQVSWLATDGGWVGLRPLADGSARRLVDVVPVRPEELGAWVAPAVGALLEASDDLA